MMGYILSFVIGGAYVYFNIGLLEGLLFAFPLIIICIQLNKLTWFVLKAKENDRR